MSGQEEDRRKLQQLSEDFSKADKNTPVKSEGKPSLIKLHQRMSDLLGVSLDKAGYEGDG